MSRLFAMVMLGIASTVARSDEIVLTNGIVMKGCEILDTVGTVIKYRQILDTPGGVVQYRVFDDSGNTIGSIDKSRIQQLIFSNRNNPPQILETEKPPGAVEHAQAYVRSVQDTFPTIRLLRYEKRHVKLGWLVIAVGTGILAFDFLSEGADYGNSAGAYDRMAQLSTGYFQSSYHQIANNYRDIKVKKTVVGYGFAVACVGSLILAFQTEEWAIFTNGMEIKVQHNF